jgi:lipoprotein-anchoring transpeptidase ErfK/SrfK
VKVYFSGKLVRTMPTSMGQHTGETVNGNYISFFTMDGTYTVLEHDDPAIMSSASYGLPANAPGGYAPEPIYYATKISTDGIYLHELDTTVWAQDNGIDVSHGCLNLNQSNAIWYYDNSQIGDVVEILHNGGPTIQIWQNGDWSVPWSTWVAGSALR